MLRGFWRKNTCFEDFLFTDSKTAVDGVDSFLARAFCVEVDRSETAECIDSLTSLADYCESRDGARGFDDSKKKVRVFCAPERSIPINRNDQIQAFAEELNGEREIFLKNDLFCSAWGKRDSSLLLVVFVCASDLVREVTIKNLSRVICEICTHFLCTL